MGGPTRDYQNVREMVRIRRAPTFLNRWPEGTARVVRCLACDLAFASPSKAVRMCQTCRQRAGAEA